MNDKGLIDMTPMLLMAMAYTLFSANIRGSSIVENEFDFLLGRNLILGSSSFEERADSGFGINANFRHYMSDQWSVGLGYHYLDFTDVETKDNVLHVLTSYETKYKDFIPYGTGGLGVAKVSDHPISYSKLSLYGAVGVRKVWRDNIKFNVSINLHHIPENDDQDNSHTIISPMFGITYSLSSKESFQTTYQHHKTEIVLEDLDEDRDGIVDEEDQCPGTPAGIEVNFLGCLKNKNVNISLDVKFDLASAEFDRNYVSHIKRLANVMNKNVSLNIEIQGHTDNTGPEEGNRVLSQKRAESIKNYLVEFYDINEGRIKAKGYGSLVPVASNETEQGRKKNRRVEVKLMIR